MPDLRSRRLVATVAIGLTFSFAPLPVLGLTAQADAPAAAVTGLSRGARGEAVRALQQALVEQGVELVGGIDGVFGSATEQAVSAFQQRQGIAPSGSVDLATAIALGLESSPLLGLTQGNRGDRVRSLQQALVAAGNGPRGGVDGIFGPATTEALGAFQRSSGLSASGAVDAPTAAALAAIEVPAGDGTAVPRPETSGGGADAPEATSLAGLRIGARGAVVERVQRILIGAGFTVVGGADGVYGVLTASAVRSFQNANGLPLTGNVDAATAEVLLVVEGRQGGATDPQVREETREETHDPAVSSPFAGLQYGSLGSDVVALQRALIDAGITVRGGADGVFGPATRDAVRAFQRLHGLEATGKVDSATAGAFGSRSPGAPDNSLVGLRAGALGNTVVQLQEALIEAGVALRGGADGIFGPATAQALREFQTSQGLEATGVVDDATAAALASPRPAVPPDGGGSELGYPVYGERGDRVRALQQALVDAGITVRGGVDGDFGGGTSAAVMEFQRQRGLAVTGKIDLATAEALGLEPAPPPVAPDAGSVTLGAFPVQGTCHYGDSYGYPRSGGRVHLGVDIIAPEGRLVYAAADGRITKVYRDYPGSLAGNGIRLEMADSTYFFYAHMSSLADGIGLGTRVTAGQIVGFVGNTGSSGTPHLHFEIHPRGGTAINPYPLVRAIDGCSRTEPLPQP